MLKKLMARHRVLRLGAGLLGASVLAVGFASPAFATQSSGGNAASANYNIYQGGSNTTYLMMTQLSDLFNASPGCDLASSSGTAQPLDYGCPGLNDPGTTLSHGDHIDGHRIDDQEEQDGRRQQQHGLLCQ